MLTLRDYQEEACASILEKFQEHTSTLLQAFTSSGKTVMIAEVIRRMHPKRALVLAHTEELIFQNAKTIREHTGFDVQIEMANLKANTDMFTKAEVVVGTWQTQVAGRDGNSRMQKFRPQDFGLLVLDEAHRSTAPSLRKIVDYYRKNPELKILGATATPKRSDNEALNQVFESVAGQYDIHYGVEHGWLVDITQQYVSVSNLDFSHLHTINGDFDKKELAALMESQPIILGVCQPSLEILFGLKPKTLTGIPVPEWKDYLTATRKVARKAIVFTASVFQAELCCNMLNGAMPGMAEWLCGETPKEQRRKSLERFAEGTTRVLVNVAVLTEGYNHPEVEVALVCRPTKSVLVYEQMIGRILRPLSGTVDDPSLDTPEKRIEAIKQSAKPLARIIDFVGNAGKHKLVSCIDILGGKVSDQAKERLKKKMMADGANPKRVSVALENAEREIEEERKKKKKEQINGNAKTQGWLVGKSEYSTEVIDPFRALGVSRANPFSRSRDKDPTPKMVNFLANRRIDCKRLGIKFREAGKLIRAIKEQQENMPATPKQAKVLKKYGLDINVPMDQASAWIDAIAKNGWKKPDWLEVPVIEEPF